MADTAIPPQVAKVSSLRTRVRSLGPGLLFTLSMLGPASLVENVTIGASRGYELLWVVPVLLAFRFLWLNLSAQYVLASGETLLDGYRRCGRWIPWLVLGSLLAERHLSNFTKIVLMGLALDLLLQSHAGTNFWSLFFAAAGLFLMTRRPRTVERWLRPVIIAMGVALLAAALRSHPHIPGILHGLFVFSLADTKGPYSRVLMITALIGTETGALTNLSYSYFMLQKGWRKTSDLPRQRFDLLYSLASIFVIDVLLQIAAAGTLFPARLIPKNAEDMVTVFSSTLGLSGRVIFAFGLWAVCFSGFVSGTAGSALVASDILKGIGRRKKTKPDSNATGVQLFLLAFWAISPLYALFLHVHPVYLVLAASSLTLLLMPALAIALMLLMNGRRLGRYRSGLAANLGMGVLVLASLYLSVTNAIQLFKH